MAFTQTKKFDSGVLRLTDNTNIFIGEPIWIVNNYALKLNITKSTYTEDLDTKELNENCYGVFKSFKNAVYWLRENKGIFGHADKNVRNCNACYFGFAESRTISFGY